MTTSHWLRPHSFKVSDVTCDVVIVGGGYVGLSTAYWISEMRPDLKVVVIDRSFCGSGASGRNAGFLTIGSASFYKSLNEKWGTDQARLIHTFATESLELAHQHLLKISPELKYEKSSSLTLLQNESQVDEWRKSGYRAEDFSFEWKEKDQLPLPLQNKFFAAFESGPEYKVNPFQLLSSMKKLLEARKVQFIEQSAAFEILDDGVATEQNIIKAKQVVLALNGYFPEFNQKFSSLITPRRAQMLSVELEEDIHCPHLYYDPKERVYWRKASDKILLIGGKRLLDEKSETGTFEKISSIIQEGLESYLKNQLSVNYKIINRWSGTMAFTDHELPFLNSIQAKTQTYVVGGFSGHGMGLGFHAGKEVAEVVLQNKLSFFNQFKKAEITL